MRFFLHLHECGSVTIDDEGFEFASIEEAHAEALRAARDMMCSELQDGKLCLNCYIEVARAGASSFDVSFRDAVVITGA